MKKKKKDKKKKEEKARRRKNNNKKKKQEDQPLWPRARSAFWGVWGAQPPRKQGGAGGAAPPPPCLARGLVQAAVQMRKCHVFPVLSSMFSLPLSRC